MNEQVRKTIRFSQEEIDYIMNNEDLKDWRRDYRKTSFSERLRILIKQYQQQKEKIDNLVRQIRNCQTCDIKLNKSEGK